MVSTGESLRVEAASRGLRRFSLAFGLLLVAYAAVVAVWGGLLDVGLALLLLAAHLRVTLANLTTLEIDDAGLVLDQRVRRRVVGWSDVAVIRLRWHWAVLRPRLPEIERLDGTRVRSGVLGHLGVPAREEERTMVLDRLRWEAARHGFALEIHGPRVGPGGEPDTESGPGGG